MEANIVKPFSSLAVSSSMTLRMIRVTKALVEPFSSSFIAPYLAWWLRAWMAWLATWENGSAAPCVLISFSTSSSELEAQKWFRNRVERPLTRQLVNDLTKMRYQLINDMRIRMTNRV